MATGLQPGRCLLVFCLTAILGKNDISWIFYPGVFPSLVTQLHSKTTKKPMVEWLRNDVKWVNSAGFPPVSTWRTIYCKCSPVSAFHSTAAFSHSKAARSRDRILLRASHSPSHGGSSPPSRARERQARFGRELHYLTAPNRDQHSAAPGSEHR